MTTEEVKQIIADCKFNPDLKQRLSLILPHLEKNTLLGLGEQVSRGDAIFAQDYLVSLWESFASLLDGLKTKNVNLGQNLEKFLNEELSRFHGEDELYVLNFVLDVRSLTDRAQVNLPGDQYKLLLDFEIKLFWKLPEEEVMFLLQNFLILLESKVNLLEHVKVVIRDNDWDFSPEFPKNFSDILYQSKEKFAGKTVGDWIKNYFNFSSSAAFRKDVMQVAEYLIKDPEVKKLNEEDKKTLSEILKLYAWLLNPEINEDEVRNYKEEITDREAALIDQIILSSFGEESSQQNQKATPPPVPFPKSTPTLKPIEEITVLPKRQSQPLPKPFEPRPVQAQSAPKPYNVMPQAKPQSRMNIQDILKSRYEQEEGQGAAGLVIGGGAGLGQMPRPKIQEVTPSSVQASSATAKTEFTVGRQEKQQTQAEIDKKLEELEKRIK